MRVQTSREESAARPDVAARRRRPPESRVPGSIGSELSASALRDLRLADGRGARRETAETGSRPVASVESIRDALDPDARNAPPEDPGDRPTAWSIDSVHSVESGRPQAQPTPLVASTESSLAGSGFAGALAQPRRRDVREVLRRPQRAEAQPASGAAECGGIMPSYGPACGGSEPGTAPQRARSIPAEVIDSIVRDARLDRTGSGALRLRVELDAGSATPVRMEVVSRGPRRISLQFRGGSDALSRSEVDRLVRRLEAQGVTVTETAFRDDG